MKIQNKSDWSHVYMRETPKEYMLFSLEQGYVVPEYAICYLMPLFQKLVYDFGRPVNVMDLGSSYGIISTLALCNLTWLELIDFYVQDNQLTSKDIEKFYNDRLNLSNRYKFYLLDSSKPAIEFARQYNLCEKGYVFNLKNQTLTDDLKKIVQRIDVFLCVGSISYFGSRFFEQVLPLATAKGHLPLLAFSTYPLFYYDVCANDIESEFRKYGYDFICCNIPGKGRRMTDDEYNLFQSRTDRVLSDTCCFESEGYLTSKFYLAIPKDRKTQFANWMIDVERNIKMERRSFQPL